MKTRVINSFVLLVQVGTLGCVSTGQASAQTLKTLYSFEPNATGIYSDGGAPVGGLVLSGNTLYGTTFYGGTVDSGTVFAMNTDGTGFRVLHDFPANTNGSTNTGGANPASDLILSSNILY